MSVSELQELMQGCDKVYTEKELGRKLEIAGKDRRPLRIKLGLDPTAPDIHLGHSVVLRKMRQFQDMGHTAVLLIGDFTALIGDPTGRSKTRPVLTTDQIDANAETYLQQAGRVLDMSDDKLEIRRNSEWFSKMSYADVIRLAGRITVGQLLQREDFRKRYQSETPISLHELLYPVNQGWDSVELKADVELGGTDQTYNNLVGRDLQQQCDQPPQVVMVMPLLRGTDGSRKMSKSYGNTIGLADSPQEMFGKTMSIPDELMPEWFTLLTSTPEEQWKPAVAQDPMQAKKTLARRIGELFYDADSMRQAEADWHERFSARTQPDAVDVAIPAGEMEGGRIMVWKLAWLAHDREISKSEARRMVQGGAFAFDGEKITDPRKMICIASGQEFRAGRHRHGELTKQPLMGRVILE